MQSAYCLDCDRSIKLDGKLQIGDEVTCPHCESEFTLIDLNPPELEWLYEDDADLDDDDDEEEDEEDDETVSAWSWKLAKRQRIITVDQTPARGDREARRNNEREHDL